MVGRLPRRRTSVSSSTLRLLIDQILPCGTAAAQPDDQVARY
jgi:hypothetical protein